MIRRAFWVSLGAGLGVGGSYYAQKAAKEVAARYTPTQLSLDAADVVKRLGRDVRDAVREGRQAMAEREADMRADLEGRLLTPELEARLRAELIDRALPPEIRAELIRQALPPDLEAVLLERRLTPEVEQQLRAELASRRARDDRRELRGPRRLRGRGEDRELPSPPTLRALPSSAGRSAS